MNIFREAIVNSSIIRAQSQVGKNGFLFIDAFQVPQGKVGYVLEASLSASLANGANPGQISLAVCDQTYNFGIGPSASAVDAGKNDPDTFGVCVAQTGIILGNQAPFNAGDAPMGFPIAVPELGFIRVTSVVAPGAGKTFTLNLLVALLDKCGDAAPVTAKYSGPFAGA